MTKKEEKNVISFETEGEVHEEAQALLNEVESYVNEDMPEYKFIAGFRKTADLETDVYKKNLRLLEKAQEMNKIIITNAQKVKTIFELVSKDNNSLEKLKEEYEEAMKVISASYKSEKGAKIKIAELRNQVSTLANQVRQGEAFSFGTDQSIFETSNEVNNLKKELATAIETRTSLEQQIEEKSTMLAKLQTEITKLKSEDSKLTKSLSAATAQFDDLEKDNNETTNDIMEINPQIKELKQQMEQNVRNKSTKGTQLTQLKQVFYDTLSNLNATKDELKQHKDKIVRRTKVFNEFVHKTELMNEEKENKVKMLKQQNDEKENYILKLNEANEEGVEMENQLAEQVEISKHITEEKAETRKLAKERRQTILDTVFKLSTEENSKYTTQRQTSEVRGTIQKDHQKKMEEAAETSEEKSKAKTIRSETISEKTKLQEMKEKILALFKEIDLKRTEHFQIQSRILVTQDFIKSTNEQFEQHTKEFETYKTKNEHQTALSEKTRIERNTYKRNLETIEKENSAILAQIDQLAIVIKETSDRIAKISNNIFDDHVGNMMSKGESKYLIEKEKEQKKMILQVERVISRLNAERQTLSYILHEAENDHKEQKNEYNNVVKNIEIERDENIERQRKIDDLKSQIETNLNLISRSKEMYQEKMDEIIKSRKEIDNLDKQTKQLERKRDLVKQLQFREHKISTELMLEAHKSMTLIHEFAVPRNVHRWNALEAVDPGYVKNLKYRMDLFTKLDVAHRELILLQQERDNILKSLGINKDKMSKALTKSQCEQYIIKYKSDIERMNQQIKEMQETAHESHPSINKSTATIEIVRGKINQRKSSASTLHNKINTIHIDQFSDSNIPRFMTESETYVPTLGGGFVSKILSPTVRRDVNSELAVVGQSRPQTVAKVVSPLLSPQKSKSRRTPLPPLNKL